MKILITGAAGFIGSNLTKGLLEKGCSVIGLDAGLKTTIPWQVKRWQALGIFTPEVPIEK